MNASDREVELSRVASLLGELDGTPIKRNDWDGYHKAVYCKNISKEEADSMVNSLCERLQLVDASEYSLEMQMWWRDHQEADQARLRKEMAAHKTEQERTVAISKLTRHECFLLGINPDKQTAK